MSSEDAKTVLLAFIAFLGTLTTTGGTLLGTYLYLRLKAIKQDQDATKSLINGRMDELLRKAVEKAFAEGHAAGVAATCKSLGDKPNVPVAAQELAQAVADTVTAPAKVDGSSSKVTPPKK